LPVRSPPLNNTPFPRARWGESGLPLPSTFATSNDPGAFQNVLSSFLTKGTYETLGWCHDKTVRDTGRYIAGAYYGTHPVVRVWYSLSFTRWTRKSPNPELPTPNLTYRSTASRRSRRRARHRDPF
jgi:hypothetical protein